MGVTTLLVKIKNPKNPKKTVERKFLVDSGAVYSVVPRKVLQELDIKPSFRQKFSLADGSIVEWQGGNAFFEYKGQERGAPVIFGEKGDIFLLGVTTLEAFGFILDPITRELRPMPMLLMLAMPIVNFNPGDTIRVHQKVQEVVTTAGKTKKSKTSEVKTRTQVFEGIVLSIRGMGENKSFMVRKKSYDGVDVERIWQLNSPTIVKIEIKAKPKKRVRRAKLYYLRTVAHA